MAIIKLYLMSYPFRYLIYIGMSNNGLKTSSITHITIKNEQPCKYYVKFDN